MAKGDESNEEPKGNTTGEGGGGRSSTATSDRSTTTDNTKPTDRVSADTFNQVIDIQSQTKLGSFTAGQALDTARTNLVGAGLANDGTIDVNPASAYKLALAGRDNVPVGAPSDVGVKQPTDAGLASSGNVQLDRNSKFAAPEGFKPDDRKTDGKIDLPKDKPANMSDEQWKAIQDQVEKLNQQLTPDGRRKNELTDQQAADIERGVEDLIRGKNPDGSDKRPPLDPSEIAGVLDSANTMLSADKATLNARGFEKKDRNMAVSAMVDDIANPDHMNQGLNQTCNATTEARIEAMTHPSAQAKVMADLYTNTGMTDKGGNYVEVHGQKVYYDAASVKGGNEAQFAEDYRGANARDAYSQALNHIYVNAVSQPKGLFYTDGDPTSNSDTGEAIHRGGFNTPALKDSTGRKMDASDLFRAEDVQRLSNLLGNGALAANFNRFGVGDGGANPGVMNVGGTSGMSFDEAWEKNGGKPMTIAVDTNSKLFNPQAGDGGVIPGGGHVVNVTDRRENPPGSGHYEYYMMNQWGSNNPPANPPKNRWVSSEELEAAMNPQEGSKNKPPAGYTPPYSAGTEPVRPNNVPGGGGTTDGPAGGKDTPYSAPKGGGIQDRDNRSELYKEEEERWKKMDAEQRKKAQEEEDKKAREARLKAEWENDINNPDSPNYWKKRLKTGG